MKGTTLASESMSCKHAAYAYHTADVRIWNIYIEQCPNYICFQSAISYLNLYYHDLFRKIKFVYQITSTQYDAFIILSG